MRLLLLTITLVMTLSGLVHAQPTEIDKDAARAAVQQGDERMAEEDYKGALEAYKRADDIMGVPTTSIEVGRANLLLGQLVEAHAAFERASKYEYVDGEPEPFTTARDEARKLASELADRIPTVTVTVARLPDGSSAALTIDGRHIDSGSVIRLNPGSHEVDAVADGYLPINEAIDLAEWDNRRLSYTMTAEPDTLWPMVWIGYGLAGAGLVVGSITGGISLSSASEAKELCGPNPDECNPDAESPKEQSIVTAHVSTASFAVAGAAAIVGTVGLILSLGAESDAGVGITPTSATLRLRF